MLRRLISPDASPRSPPPSPLPAAAANPQVEFDTTAGKIRVELYPDAAPKTVANFLDYVKARPLRRHAIPSRDPRIHDPGRRLHRRLQAEADAGRPIVNEAEQSSKAGLLNVPGTLAMARTSDPNSATGAVLHQRRRQQVPQLPLADPAGIGYTVFGKVVSGMDVVDKIAKAPTGAGGPFPKDVPVEKVIITKAIVVDAK